jgi:Polyketide cyclase / dehydrase and lipid transport
VASIRKETLIEARPEQVWAALRDVGAVHHRLLPGYVVDTQLDGDIRILTFPSGGVVRELIVAIDDDARRLAYAVIEGRMPLVHHHASFQVFAEGASRSRLVWITDVLPHALAAEIRLRVERGADIMKQTLEEEAARANRTCS